MIHCEKGHENPDGALFCKECGNPLGEFGIQNSISFKKTFQKIHPSVLLLAAVTVINGIISIVDGIISDKTMYGISELPLIIMLPVLFFALHPRWKKFEMHQPVAVASEKIQKYVYSKNKEDELIKIKKTKEGGLYVRFKSFGLRGRFHLFADTSGETVIVSEKYYTQVFIRSVFGDDLNFIEY